jgi:LacI family transcriptional regulator
VAGKQATLHDVARLADVSHQTVSRVINDSPNVAAATREKVIQAIHKLNYRPNRAARSLITGRSQTLQVIDFDANFMTPIPPIVNLATERGYQVGVSTLRSPESLVELHRLFDDLTSRIVDGFLFFAMDMPMEAGLLDRLCRGIPYVQLGAAPAVDVPAVVFDQRHGMHQVMQHLFDLGHHKIAELTGRFAKVDGRIRHDVYLEMMAGKGLEPGPWREGDFTVHGGYVGTRQLLEQGLDFTALVCGNDQMALGALHALHEANFRVPEDVSVVGFDDEAFVAYYEPPLTTMRQDFQEQARQGIEYLIQLIDDPETKHEHKVICPHLIIRNSTAPAVS